MRARTIASVTGSRITNDVPLPSTVRISIEPPSARMRVTATSIPTPRPDTLVTASRSEEHTSELQSRLHLVCRLLLEKKKKKSTPTTYIAKIAHCTQSAQRRHV